MFSSLMPLRLLYAHVVRKEATLHDLDGRSYKQLTKDEVRFYSLATGRNWWWCVLPLRKKRFADVGNIPQPGSVVGHWLVHHVEMGFVRGRTVGIVELQ